MQEEYQVISNTTEKKTINYYVSNMQGDGAMDIELCASFEVALERYLSVTVDGKVLGYVIEGMQERVLAKFSTVEMRNQYMPADAYIVLNEEYFQKANVTEETYSEFKRNVNKLQKELGKDNVYQELQKGFANISLYMWVDIGWSRNEWGSWRGRVAIDGKPQDYVSMTVDGYDERHELIYSMQVIKNNNLVAWESFKGRLEISEARIINETDIAQKMKSSEEYENSVKRLNSIATEKLEIFFRAAATEIYTDKDSATLYAYQADHTIEEHYQLLRKAGYGEFPNYGPVKDITEDININYVKEKKTMSKEERETMEKEYVGITFYGEDIIKDDIHTKDGKILTKVYAGDGKHFLVNNDYVRQSKENKDCYFITGLTTESYLYLESSKKEGDAWVDVKEKVSALELKEMMKKVGFTITKKQANFHEGERGGFVSIILPHGTERAGYVYTVNERQVRESEKNENLLCVRMFAKEVHKARKYEEREVVDEVQLNGEMLRICYDEAFKYSKEHKEEKADMTESEGAVVNDTDTPFNDAPEKETKDRKASTKGNRNSKKESGKKASADLKQDELTPAKRRGKSR